jgi:hypothetical protein
LSRAIASKKTTRSEKSLKGPAHSVATREFAVSYRNRP